MDDLEILRDSLKKENVSQIQRLKTKYIAQTPIAERFSDYSNLIHDEISEVLLPSDFSDELNVFKVCKTLGNGNCLYNAVSIILVGDEAMSTNLRILTACELYQNATKYATHENVRLALSNRNFMTTDPMNAFAMILPSGEIKGTLENSVILEAIETCTDRKWSSLLHIMALSSVLGVPIRSVYPDVNLGIRPLFNGVMNPVEQSETCTRTNSVDQPAIINIMWTRDSGFDNREGSVFEPNHFVPIVRLQHHEFEHTKEHGSDKRTLSNSPKKQMNESKPATLSSKRQKTMVGNQTKISSFFTKPKTKNVPDKTNVASGNATAAVKTFDEEKHENDDSDLEDRVESDRTPMTSICTSQCCSGDKPFQPTEMEILKQTSVQRKVKNKMVTRHVQSSWFGMFSWLTLCVERKKVFCFTCKKVYLENTNFSKGSLETSFIQDGFGNWKKAVSKFKEHEKSGCHREAEERARVGDKTIPNLLKTQQTKDQTMRKQCLQIQLSSIRYLLEQGLPLRGHRENEGNFRKLLDLRAEDVQDLKSWIAENKYLSPEVVNEQISLIAQSALRQILVDIWKAKWFTVMADESTDITNKEQLTVCVRWVDDKYVVHEDFLGLLQVPNITSAVITAGLKDVLIRCSLQLELCRGQAYDGAANMMGHISGVATVIQNEFPAALSVHCLAHCINLCLQDVTKKCKPIRDALDLILEVEKLIKYSPKREVLFLEHKSEISPVAPNLRPLCPTRWTARTGSIDAILRNYETLLDVLHEIDTSTTDEYSRRAGGQAAMMEKFSTFFGLKLSHLLFGAGEQLSISVQGVMTSVQDAQKAAEKTKLFYESQRQETAYDAFYESVCEEAKELTDEPTLPRYKRVPKKIDEGKSESHRFQTPKEYFRQQYKECIDLVKQQIEKRFQQRNMDVVKDIESVLLTGANGDAFIIPDSIKEIYSSDICMERLAIQLRLLPGLFTGKVKRISNVDTISQFMSESESLQRLMSEVDKLVRLYLTIPVTTATPERSFSSLRRIKNYLRGTMTQERLNNCMVCYVHNDVAASLDLRKIAKSFASENSRRKGHFGEFI